MNIIKKIPFIFFIFIYELLLYRNWFFPGVISAGDFWPTDPRVFSEYSLLPYAWNSELANGFGAHTAILLWNYFFFQLPFLLWGALLHLPYQIVERFGYLFPLIILSLFSAYLWSRYFFTSLLFRLFAACIFVTNTYILMAIDGGQLGIAFGYLFAPFVFLAYVQLYEKISAAKKPHTFVFIKQSLLIGMLIAVQINFDLRMTYITLLSGFIYLLVRAFFENRFVVTKLSFAAVFPHITYFFFLPGLCVILLHAFWILPLLAKGFSSSIEYFTDSYTTESAVSFLSFGTFSQALSLLHPNWPENIFGKVYFMRYEFLLIPLLAFSSFLFITKKVQNYKELAKIIPFGFVGLLGVFLAKGANDPFGSIYLWLFSHIPGFIMFRDSTKFYLIIALAYSILIPYTLQQRSIFFKKKPLFYYSLLGGVFIYLLFLLSPAFTGVVNGNLLTRNVPKEYEVFNNLLFADTSFSRVLWLPEQNRFGAKSQLHPGVNSNTLFATTDLEKLVAIVEGKNKRYTDIKKYLQTRSIAYLVIPLDTDNEFFVRDRKYDSLIRERTIKRLDAITWLSKDKSFKSLAVYKIENAKDFFWDTLDQKYTWNKISPVSYHLSIADQIPKKVTLSQNFDSQWRAIGNKKEINSEKSSEGFNSFTLQKGEYTILYQAQSIMNVGAVVSLISSIILLIAFLIPERIYKRFL